MLAEKERSDARHRKNDLPIPTELAETLRGCATSWRMVSVLRSARLCAGLFGTGTRRRDGEPSDLEILRTAIGVGLDRGPGRQTDEVVAELRTRYATKS